MADYWQQKDASRPEDEWQLPIDHPDNQENPEPQGNKFKDEPQARPHTATQEQHAPSSGQRTQAAFGLETDTLCTIQSLVADF